MNARPLPTPDGGRQPRPVGDGLDRLLRHLGAPSSSTVAGVFDRWEEVVGERLAAHLRPVAVKDGALVVAVDDPAWASELKWLGDDLVERAREVLGDSAIERLEIRVRPGPSADGSSAVDNP